MNQINGTHGNAIDRMARKAKTAMRRKNRESLAASVRKTNESREVTILGPYRNRDKWRLVIIDGSERKALCASTRDEALELKAQMSRENERSKGQTIGMVLQEYQSYLVDVRGILPQTAKHTHDLLARWLPVSLLTSSLTPQKAERLYVELTQAVSKKTKKPLAVSTHHLLLTLAKGWGKWAQKQRYVSVNPFAEVARLGKRRAGKVQLRIDEAKQLSRTAEAMANAGDTAALGVLLMLHLGLRQGEVGARVARDVDANGTILWIPSGKTKNATRRLKVPAHLHAPLRALASKKEPNALLFSDGPKPPRRQYFWEKVRQLCVRAKVPVVCPHSLRGLHATLALEAGATSAMVAHALGHGSFEITARHYASADSVQGSRAAIVAEALSAGDNDSVSRLLAGLTPAQLAELKGRLK